MNKQLLGQLQARHEQRLSKLQGQIESGEVREADLPAVQEEIEGLIDELEKIKDELGSEDDADGEADGDSDGNTAGTKGQSEGNSDDGTENTGEKNENRSGMITQQQRDGLLGSIRDGLNSHSSPSGVTRKKQIRQAFAKFVVGQYSESEARSLGIVNGNGAVVVPKELVPEVISYAQEINPLRTDGTMHPTDSALGFPVLVKKATAQGHKGERGSNDSIPDSAMEFDEIELEPTEFDALALITKKLMKRSDLNVDDIVMEELGKAYAEKEGVYFFRGDETKNENPGALAKKAIQFYATKEIDDNGTPKVVAIDSKNGAEVHDALVDFKNSLKATVRKKSKWYLNDAAFSVVEKMKDNDGNPLYSPTQLADGIGGKLLGYPVTVTEFADKAEDDPDTPVFFFGDPKSFHMQEVDGGLEVQKLIERYSDTNHIGLKIYNLIDGQLVYSPLEPTMAKLELGSLPPAP